jgi:hypothetical protein
MALEVPEPVAAHRSTLKRMDKVTGRARPTGEFPGSPVELDHIFKLSNDKIASLEIRS